MGRRLWLSGLLVVLLGCAPVLRNPGDDDATDDDDSVDDDDTVPFEDPCCSEGTEGTWESCSDREAALCVCAQDSFCCEEDSDHRHLSMRTSAQRTLAGAVACAADYRGDHL